MGQIKKNKKEIRVLDVDDEEEVSRYCFHCAEYGFQNKLGPKILVRGEIPARDHDSWCQCIKCGHIYPKHQTKIESKLQDFVETSSNPFDVGKHIIGLGNKRHKKNKYEKLLEDIEQEPDSDIRTELRKGNTVTIIE
jgi:hypothetical protein